MTREEAKQTLLLYRPAVPESDEPAMTAALALAERDPALKSWLENHLTAQQSLRQTFRALPAPKDLPDQIFATHKTMPLPLWKRPFMPWLAAAVLLLLGFLVRQTVFTPTPDQFQNFQRRMVSSVLREYRMDIVTNRAEAVRDYMEAHEAPATYELPPALTNLKLTGGGLLRWRNHPVSMICYDRGTNQMIFLFVLDRQAPRNPPSSDARVQPVNKLITASWTRGDWAYFMAAEQSPGFPEDYLPANEE